MLSKHELALEIEGRTGVKPNLSKRVMDTMADVAVEQIKQGEEFSVPGICRIGFRYTKPRRKGDKYVGFGGEEKVAEKNVAAKLAFKKTTLNKRIKDALPKLSTKAGKAIAERKGG